MLLARPGSAAALEGQGVWTRRSGPTLVWTDDFSNLYGVFDPF